ncbi:hypothetical protein JI435_201580 [Parastagonospora nodorum SN15]|uniref:Uncharacterized protein n=1 Tax=Phaeosphaeria nodorum (strain SN15 / ATCC MYA-4574 / FGSC 10173) TaxID=321614 RepID=A0A7U2FCZ5_PHANO|nr:hypothetical protein JI435_201580 [Parastagonospora nodorum SN15]
MEWEICYIEVGPLIFEAIYRLTMQYCWSMKSLGGRMGGEMCITPAHLDSGRFIPDFERIEQVVLERVIFEVDHFPSTFQGTNRSAKG